MKTVIALFIVVLHGVAGAQVRPSAAVGGAAVDANKVYFEFEVERAVRRATSSTGPAYPNDLKKLGIEGEVLVQFIVDTLGFAEPASIKILKSPHELFSKTVLSEVSDMRYEPAELRSRKVKQRVTQRFMFELPK